MQYTEYNDQLLAKKGVTAEYQADWDCMVYRVCGKMFATRGTWKDIRQLITLKLEPARSDFLRRQHEEVIPGYYMNKTHWSSIYLDGQMNDEEIRALLDEAYAWTVSTLPAKTRRELEVT